MTRKKVGTQASDGRGHQSLLFPCIPTRKYTPKACRIGSSIAPTPKPPLSPVVSSSSEFPAIHSCLGQVSVQQTFLTMVDVTGKVPRAQPRSFRQTCAPEEIPPKPASTENLSAMCVTNKTFHELPRGCQESGEEKIERKKAKYHHPL